MIEAALVCLGIAGLLVIMVIAYAVYEAFKSGDYVVAGGLATMGFILLSMIFALLGGL